MNETPPTRLRIREYTAEINWTRICEPTNGVVPKCLRMMNEEAKNWSTSVPNSCQLNFITVALSLAASSSSYAFWRCLCHRLAFKHRYSKVKYLCLEIIAEPVAIMLHNVWPCFFALDHSTVDPRLSESRLSDTSIIRHLNYLN